LVGNSCDNGIFSNNVSTLLNDIEINSNSAQNNTFYHNNFLIKYHNELASIYTYNFTLVNLWDNGKEGNYWQDYNGTDANDDGIGDTPYIIDASNVDRYPLMNPWSASKPQPGLELFQTALIIIIIVLVVMGAVLAIYFKKHTQKFLFTTLTVNS
jgi:hypothetical protein